MTATKKLKYVFGPVPSRRLGRSLGVDLVPFKHCSYDCVYCQLGRTTNKTVQRRAYVPLRAVLAELKRKLADCTPDYITLSGSGEPTLYLALGPLIRGIKKITKIPVAVLTNGSLLWNRAVQDALLSADLIVPSLDGGDDAAFQYVNRPHPAITFDKMAAGLIDFRKQYSGKIWLEVFILGGITAIDSEAAKIAKLARQIRPDRIQLNTVTRPPAEEFAFPVPPQQMQRLRRLFGRNAEVIADYRAPAGKTAGVADDAAVLSMLERRPCTLKDIADGIALHPTQAGKILEHLLTARRIVEQRAGGKAYYKARVGRHAPRQPRRAADKALPGCRKK